METLVLTPALEAPAIDGLVFRPYRGEADLPAMLEVLNDSNREDRIEEVETLEGLTYEYTHLSNCDPATDIRVIEVRGRVAGYGRVWWSKNDDGERLYWLFGSLHPDWRRQGIGRSLLRWQESRAREIAAAHPEDGPRYLQTWTMDSVAGKQALLKSEGYAPARYGYMMVRSLLEPVPDVPLPDGLEVRPAQPEHLRPIFYAMNEAFRDHWGHRESTEEDFDRWSHWPMAMPHLWQVAWDGDQVAGMVLNVIFEEDNKTYHRRRGWTDPICVRRPWRRHGLARALILRSLEVLKAEGMTEAALGVDTQNPNGALHLYESCGYQVSMSSTTMRKAL